MSVEIVTAAAGVVGKATAKPLADAAMRKEAVIRALKAVRLDPKTPPQDFFSLYAYTLIEYCVGRSPSVTAFFRDAYVRDAFHSSFSSGNWSRLRDEAAEAVARNRETIEFGHLDHGFEEHVDGFLAAFQALVDRSRAPHETRVEQKVDALLEQVSRTRADEENHRARTEPGRSELSPAQRLMQDVHEWFTAVGYEVRRSWEPAQDSVALLVDIPQRRRGKFDRTVMLCVEGELLPHHLRLLGELVASESAAEGWGLARLRVSEAARRHAAGSGDVLSCYSFDELVDLEADFEPYIEWIEAEVRRRGVDSRYVPVSCRKEEIDPATQRPLDTSTYDWRDGGLGAYVEGWLQEPAKRHLSVLGEFGMGKSWFALHLAGEMARGWRDAKLKGVPRPRIPLLIPLRDYAKQTTVQGLLSEFFFNRHKIDLRSYDVFRVLNRMGRLLLIFDGFDEMAARADRHTVISNFWELANAVEPGAKVLLSSRKEHFRDADEARDLFGAKVGVAATTLPKDGPAFDIVELVRFDNEQIERMLRHDIAEDKVRLIMANEDVRELMGRPVMSELVIDALPEIERGAEIDLARIYLYAVQRKMDRDVKAERTFTSRGDKLFFLCEVASEMLSTNRLSLNYRDFPDRLRSCFGAAVQSAKDLDFWEQDMRNQGMFVRNAEGDYGPSHKSLLEFLAAFKYAAELGLLGGDFLALIPTAGAHVDAEAAAEAAEEWTWSRFFAARSADGELPPLKGFTAEPPAVLGATFGVLEQNDAVYQFLDTMVREREDHRERLLDVVRATAGVQASTGRLAANCLNLILQSGGSLEGADLSEVDLRGFAPWAEVRTESLAGANLRRADLRKSELRGLDLSGADLTGARLRGGELLDNGWFWQPVLAHSSGAVVVAGRTEALQWPTGRLDEPPLRLPLDGYSPAMRLLEWDATTWWCGDATGGRLVDATTGAVVRTVSADMGAQPVLWRGRRALAEYRFQDDRITVVDPETGRLVHELDLPPVPLARATMFMRGGSGLVVLAQDEDRLHLVTAGGDEGEGWHTLWTEECRPGSNGTMLDSTSDSALLVLDDRAVAAVDAWGPTALLDGRGLPFPVRLDGHVEAFVFRAASHMAALSIDGSLFAWRLEQSAVRKLSWRMPRVPSGIRALRSAEDGDRLVVLTNMGELWTCDFRTGEILSRTTLGSRLRGTRFSLGCGLDPAELDAIRRVGGVVEG
ncbi:NACHT domain-containing protein [Streptomyces sp. NPDC058579]|uniref:NACHT domain-containing protein n=1 Tax=Streptomyces sp. NPDC058579 TaxID=3346548 RepID=UPI003660F273